MWEEHVSLSDAVWFLAASSWDFSVLWPSGSGTRGKRKSWNEETSVSAWKQGFGGWFCVWRCTKVCVCVVIGSSCYIGKQRIDPDMYPRPYINSHILLSTSCTDAHMLATFWLLKHYKFKPTSRSDRLLIYYRELCVGAAGGKDIILHWMNGQS